MWRRKSSTRSALEKRAAPPVGSTWFAPGDVVAERGRRVGPTNTAPALRTSWTSSSASSVTSSRCSGASQVRDRDRLLRVADQDGPAAVGERRLDLGRARRVGDDRRRARRSPRRRRPRPRSTRNAVPPGPCSACAARSRATEVRIGACSSAMTTSSDGPAGHVDPDHARRRRRSRLATLDVGVAGPDDHVDRGDRLGAVGHRGDRLRAADPVHLLDAGEERGGEGHRRRRDRRRPAARRARRSGTPATAAGIAVIRTRRRVRGPPARHVEAGAVDRPERLRRP